MGSIAHDDELGADRVVYERMLPAVRSSIPRLRHELDHALRDLGAPAARRRRVALVVTEAATNAVVHAYAGAPPGPVSVAAVLAGATLVVTVSDGGRGMRPRDDSPGLGIGMSLMARCCDELRVGPARTNGGTRVLAVFRGFAAGG